MEGFLAVCFCGLSDVNVRFNLQTFLVTCDLCWNITKGDKISLLLTCINRKLTTLADGGLLRLNSGDDSDLAEWHDNEST